MNVAQSKHPPPFSEPTRTSSSKETNDDENVIFLELSCVLRIEVNTDFTKFIRAKLLPKINFHRITFEFLNESFGSYALSESVDLATTCFLILSRAQPIWCPKVSLYLSMIH